MKLQSTFNNSTIEHDLHIDATIGAPSVVPEFSWTTDALQVTFTNLTTGPAIGYMWDFGDGGTSPVFEPIHSYAEPGTYTVTLTAEESGMSFHMVQHDVTVVAAIPRTFVPTPGVDIPMEKLTVDQYAHLAVKNTTSQFPLKFYDDGNYPVRNLTFWPVPQTDYTAMLWLWQPLVNASDLDTDIIFPKGYERALRFALAVELAAEFGKEVPNHVRTTAKQSKAVVKRINSEPQLMRGSIAIASNKNALFNWLIGDTTGSSGLL